MYFYIIQMMIITILISFGLNTYFVNKYKFNSRARWFFLILAGIIYVFFASFRDVTVYDKLDAYWYYTYYTRADVSLFEYIQTSTFELGYTVFTWLIKNIFDIYAVELIIVHTFIFYSYVHLLSNAKVKGYGIFLLSTICLNLFSAYYIERMYISIAFSFLFIVALSEKKYIKSLVWCLLSILFHNSAIILIPVYCMVAFIKGKEKLRFSRCMAVVMALFVFEFAFLEIVARFMEESSKYSYYSEGGSIALGTMAGAVVTLGLAFVKRKELDKQPNLVKVIVVSTMCIFFVVPLQLKYSIMYRMTLYFIPLMFILLGILSNVYRKYKLGYWAVKMFTYVYVAYQIYSFYSNEVLNIGVPYISLFG